MRHPATPRLVEAAQRPEADVLRRTDQKYRFDMNQARLNFHFDIGHPLAGSLMISMSILMKSESLNSLKDHNLEFLY
jgi:hypothetical protein